MKSSKSIWKNTRCFIFFIVMFLSEKMYQKMIPMPSMRKTKVHTATTQEAASIGSFPSPRALRFRKEQKVSFKNTSCNPLMKY